MKPAKSILDRLIEQNLGWDVYHYSGRARPGEAIERLPQNEREALRDLKSDDLKDVRSIPYVDTRVKQPTLVFRLGKK